jgi:ketosteroid isomerase-like protein
VQDEIIERLRRGYEAFNRGDFDAVVEFMHPDVVWDRGDDARVSIEGGVVRGREAVRDLLMPDIFADQQARVERMERNGDRVLVEAVFSARGRSSGIELETRSWHVWTMDDGRARRVRLFLDRDEALQAAGLA